MAIQVKAARSGGYVIVDGDGDMHPCLTVAEAWATLKDVGLVPAESAPVPGATWLEVRKRGHRYVLVTRDAEMFPCANQDEFWDTLAGLCDADVQAPKSYGGGLVRVAPEYEYEDYDAPEPTSLAYYEEREIVEAEVVEPGEVQYITDESQSSPDDGDPVDELEAWATAQAVRFGVALFQGAQKVSRKTGKPQIGRKVKRRKKKLIKGIDY